VNGQYRKDLHSQDEKQDKYDRYQIDRINKLNLIKALELAGIRIFSFPLKPFDKEYKLHIYLTEFLNGEKVNDAENINFANNNTNIYTHFDKAENHPRNYYIDYIESINFYTKEADSISLLSLETYALQLTMPLKHKKTRDSQFYNWRSYSKTDWVLNEEISLLVYASSWYDEEFHVERFCGTVDLSSSFKDTKELLDSSPH
jgi:hypothetical protein